MSPHAMNTFVSDLVEMARAVETLPQVQRELENALKANADLLDRIQSLELRLIDKHDEIDTLHSKIREAEQARDQAETMFLEETDRTASFKSFVENLFGTAGNLLKASAPTTPLAVPEVEQVHGEASAPEVTPQTEVPAPHWYNEPPRFEGDALNIDSQSSGPQSGQSAADPTSAPTPTSSDTPKEIQFASGVESMLTEPTPGPYHDKWYSDHPGYVSLGNWLAGGGSEERYFGNKPPAQ